MGGPLSVLCLTAPSFFPALLVPVAPITFAHFRNVPRITFQGRLSLRVSAQAQPEFISQLSLQQQKTNFNSNFYI